MFKENDFHTVIEKDNPQDKEKVWTKIAAKRPEINTNVRTPEKKENVITFSRLRLFSGISSACSLIFTVIFAILRTITTKFVDNSGNNQTIAKTDVSAFTVVAIVFGIIFAVSAIVAVISLILEKRERDKASK